MLDLNHYNIQYFSHSAECHCASCRNAECYGTLERSVQILSKKELLKLIYLIYGSNWRERNVPSEMGTNKER